GCRIDSFADTLEVHVPDPGKLLARIFRSRWRGRRRHCGRPTTPRDGRRSYGLMIGLMMPMAGLTSSPWLARGASGSLSRDVDELRVDLLVGALVQDAAGGLAQHGSAGEAG